MKNYLNIIIISILFYSTQLNAQNKYLDLHANFGLPILNNTVSYTVYPENFRIYKEYNSYKDNKNKYPEQTLISVLSANNYDWDKNNYNYTIKNNPKKYLKAKEISKTDAFFELLVKLTFTFNGNQFAVIKYHIKENDKILPFANVLIKKNDKWKIIKPEGSLSKLYLMFTYLSPKAISATFKNTKINISSYDKYISNIHENNLLNINKAINSKSDNTEEEYKIIIDPVLMKIKTEFKNVAYKKNSFSDLKSDKIKTYFIKELDIQKFYQYVDESYSYAKDDNELSIFKSELSNIKITPIFRYTYYQDGKIYSIFKYKEINNKISTSFFVKKNKKWIILNKPTNNAFYTVFSKANLAFYKDLIAISTKALEINNVKKEVIEQDNIINIQKLEKVLIENQTALKNYLDTKS